MGKSNLNEFKKKHFAEAGWVFGRTFAEFLVSIGFWKRSEDDGLYYLQDLMDAWGNLAPAHHKKLLELQGLSLYSIPYNPPWSEGPDSIDWDEVAPEYKYMARQDNGIATLYQKMPVWDGYSGNLGWEQEPEDAHLRTANANAFESYTRGKCDAMYSLVERPE